MRKIAGAQPPPKLGASVLLVRWPTLEKPMTATMLGEVPIGLMVHWVVISKDVPGATRICHRPRACPYCGNGIGVQYRLYLPIYWHDMNCGAVLPLTLDAWERMARQLPADDAVRGTKWLMTRTGGKVNGPIHFSRLAQTWRAADVPPCPDIRPALRAVYGADLPSHEALPEVGDEMGGLT